MGGVKNESAFPYIGGSKLSRRIQKLAQGVVYEEILNGPTAYLSRLQSHITTLQQGAGYQPHSDAYDVAILLLRGTVETLGQIVEAHSVIFYRHPLFEFEIPLTVMPL